MRTRRPVVFCSTRKAHDRQVRSIAAQYLFDCMGWVAHRARRLGKAQVRCVMAQSPDPNTGSAHEDFRSVLVPALWRGRAHDDPADPVDPELQILITRQIVSGLNVP